MMSAHACVVLLTLLLIAVLGTLRAEGKVIEDGPQHLSEMSSVGQSLRTAGQHPVHILYVHGMDAMGAGDSWAFQKRICSFLEGCRVPDTPVPVEREYVNRGIFQIGANPPAFEYMGKAVWSSPVEWSASAPFVDHYVLTRSDGGPVVVDEINWWPLVFPLKCRNIMSGEARLAGPDVTLLELCSRDTKDAQNPGRFESYQWVSSEDAAKLKSMPRRGAWLNRSLKNNILDWGVSDAFLVVGSMRSVFRDGMRQLFVKSASFHANGTKTNEWQQELKSGQGMDREFIVVSHSLGSYLVFSTLNIGQLDDVAADEQTSSQSAETTEDAAARYILERTSLVYFFANQVGLLELANEATAEPVSTALAQTQPTQQATATLSKRMAAWGKLREKYRQRRSLTEQLAAPPQVIAWSDPSDLLTWHVPAIDGIKVDNVYVRNCWWHWIAAGPTKAHVGYASNKTVLAIMMGR